MDSTTFGLSPKKLIRLFHIGSDKRPNAKATDSDTRASLLTRWLEETLPPEAGPTGSSLDDRISQVPVERLLRGKTDLHVITALKQYTKTKVGEADDQAHGDVATAIYYACIASALVHHGQQISSIPYRDLVQALLALQKKEWMNPGLSSLFEEAQAVCEQRKNTQ